MKDFRSQLVFVPLNPHCNNLLPANRVKLRPEPLKPVVLIFLRERNHTCSVYPDPSLNHEEAYA
jgi:hypothetical protein